MLKIKENPPRTVVTLEWNADDVGKAFAAQFKGVSTPVFDDISRFADGGLGDPFVLSKITYDGKMVGVSAGRARDFYHNNMISLAFLDTKLAEEGKELSVIWGTDPKTAMPIRVKVAAFPYYNEEYRNETFDVEKIPHPVF